MTPFLSEADLRFCRGAVRRRRLFLALSIVGLAMAAALAGYYGYRRLSDPGYAIGARAVVVLLVLLGARQNLRQYRYATILDKLGHRPSS